MPSKFLGLSREQLRQFLPDHQSIRVFEQLQNTIGTDIPDESESNSNAANDAFALAVSALAQLVELISELEQALSDPAQPSDEEAEDFTQAPALSADDPEDMAPAIQIGTIASQNADEVEITGGSIDGAVIGATTPANGTFGTLASTGSATIGDGNGIRVVTIAGNNTGSAGGSVAIVKNAASNIIAIGNKSAILGGAYDATPYLFHNGTLNTHGNTQVNGNLAITGNIGFYNTAPAAKPTVTGSRGGNAALASLLTALAGLGLITDSSTP